jgi:hypothetical protein
MPPLLHQGTPFYMAQDKAGILATHFETMHGLTSPPQLNRHAREVERLVQDFRQKMGNSIDVTGHIIRTEAVNNIRKLKPRTAPGEDGIANILIRNFTPNTITHLTYIFSSILRLGYFPARRKQALVLAIPKPHKPPQDPGSYRPISLLPTLSKLLERSVAKRITRHARLNNVLPDEQFVFRKRHSTIAQLARLTDFITHGYNVNKHTGLVLLDIEKAYDTEGGGAALQTHFIWFPGVFDPLPALLPHK